MNFIIDIGNTFTKMAYFRNEIISEVFLIKNNGQIQTSDFKCITNLNKKVNKTIISSVSDSYPVTISNMLKNMRNVTILNNKTKLPIKIIYKSPKTLGNDRIAAAVEANNIFPDTNVLVIDAGTALTIDFVTKKNEYKGGNISPGLTMRYNALNKMTNKLPLLTPDTNFNKLTGTNTKEAILAGVQNGIIFELNTYIEEYSNKYPDLKVVLTGGDIFFFEKKLKKDIFANSYLVLNGLNRILQYNEK